MHLNRRRFVRSLVPALGLSAGCVSNESTEASLEHHFGFGWDKQLVENQPTEMTETTGWIEYTTDPQRAREMIHWEEMLESLGEDAPGSNEFYQFESGKKCLVAVVAHHAEPGYVLESVEQKHGDMFDTGELELEFVKYKDVYHFDYLYDVSLWDLNGESVSGDLELSSKTTEK